MSATPQGTVPFLSPSLPSIQRNPARDAHLGKCGDQRAVQGACVEWAAPSMGDTWGTNEWMNTLLTPWGLRKERPSVGICEEPERVRDNRPQAIRSQDIPHFLVPAPTSQAPSDPSWKAVHCHHRPGGGREATHLETLNFCSNWIFGDLEHSQNSNLWAETSWDLPLFFPRAKRILIMILFKGRGGLRRTCVFMTPQIALFNRVVTPT